MANLYWRGGTGNWSDTNHWSTSSGGSGGASVPTSSDDAIFDANSGTGTCTINATANCCNLDFSASTLLTLSGSSILNVYGNLNFRAGMTINFSGGIYMLGTGTYNITANSNFTSSALYLGSTGGNGGTYNLQTTLNSGTIYVVSGTFTTNNNTVNNGIQCSQYGSENTKTLNLGSSSITGWGFIFDGTKVTVNAGTSTITQNQNNIFAGNGKTFYTVIFAGSSLWCEISGANTFTNLTINGTSGVKNWSCGIYANQTVTGTFTANGASTVNRVFIKSITLGTSRTITAANVSLSNVDFQDITGAGEATWSGTSIGDALGNSGITFTTAVTRYWVGNGGSWSGTNHWSTSSGGSSGASVPLCHDIVVFDNNSFSSNSQTIMMDMPRVGKDISFNGVSNNPTLSSSLAVSIFGNLTLGSGMTCTSSSPFIFYGRSTPILTTNGVAITISSYALYLCCVGSTFTLGDDLTTTGIIYTAINGVGFNTNGKNLSAGTLDLGKVGTATIANSTITLTGTGKVWDLPTGGLTFNKAGSIIIISDTSATGKFFYARNETYNDLTVSGDNVTIYAGVFGSSITLATLTVNTAGLTTGLKLEGGKTFNISNFTTNGSSGELAKINSSNGPTQHTLSKSSGTVSCDYLDISNSKATGGATWYAGVHSLDGGNNNGWIFGSPGNIDTNLYTVGVLSSFVERSIYTTAKDFGTTTKSLYLKGLAISSLERGLYISGSIVSSHSMESASDLETDDTPLSSDFSEQDYTNVSVDDDVFVDLKGSDKYLKFLFKEYNEADSTVSFTITWKGKSSKAPSSSMVYLQVYNRDTNSWENLDTEGSVSANTKFTLTGTKSTNLSDYYDDNYVISVRVYQEII